MALLQSWLRHRLAPLFNLCSLAASYIPCSSSRMETDNIRIELEALELVFNDASSEPMKLSYGLLRSITNNFSNEIGCGGFGVVYMGHLGNGKVAVKKFSNPHALPDKQFLGEITCLKKTKHKNIVRFIGYCSETYGELLVFDGENVMAEVQKKLLCFEYVPNGDVRHYLQQGNPHGDDWSVHYQMIRGICHGLHYLHDKQINHLDLKPENIMLDANMEPKITDFGLSRFLDQGQSKMVTKHIVGTPRYIAPEIIDKGEISFKSDMYALGIVIIELLTRTSMISLDNWDESLDVDCPRMRMCIGIARKCMDADKDKRPTICQVIRELGDPETMIPRSSVNQICERRGLLFRVNEKQIEVALIIACSGLTANVLYDGFSTPPGGYKTAGTPTLAGTYFYNAFSLAINTTLVCSALATISLMFSGVALVKLRTQLRISIYWLSCSVTSLVSAYALGLYLVLAPTATVTCPVAFLVCLLWRNMAESRGDISATTKQLARIARKAFLVFSRVVVISLRTLAAYWPLAIIFGWAALSTKYEANDFTWISSRT